MKVTKPMIIAALIAGNLLAWNLALRAADTNTPPSTPPAGGPPAGHRGPGVGGIEQLNLTADQKPKFQAIMDAQGQKMRALHADTSLSQEDRRAKMQSIHQDTTTQLKAILTADQFDKWQKMTQRGRRPGGPPPGGAKPEGTNAPPAPPKN